MGNQQSASGVIPAIVGKMHLAAPQLNIVDSTPTLVLLDTVPAGFTDGIESVVTHQITITKAGKYEIVGQVTWENLNVGASYGAILSDSLGEAYSMDIKSVSDNLVIVTRAISTICLAVGAIVELLAFQQSGVNTPDIVESGGLFMPCPDHTFLSVIEVK